MAAAMIVSVSPVAFWNNGCNGLDFNRRKRREQRKNDSVMTFLSLVAPLQSPWTPSSAIDLNRRKLREQSLPGRTRSLIPMQVDGRSDNCFRQPRRFLEQWVHRPRP